MRERERERESISMPFKNRHGESARERDKSRETATSDIYVSIRRAFIFTLIRNELHRDAHIDSAIEPAGNPGHTLVLVFRGDPRDTAAKRDARLSRSLIVRARRAERESAWRAESASDTEITGCVPSWFPP